MKVGILGAGNVGVAIGSSLVSVGHDVTVSFARTPEGVRAAAAAIGGGADAASPEDAVASADVVVLATPWAVTLELVTRLGEALADKLLWDTTNPLKPDMSGLEVGTSTSAGELIARAAPRARVVKAIVPFAELLLSGSPSITGRAPSVFVCSDDGSARANLLGLVEEIGADGVDAGPLSVARYTEPLGMLLVQLAYVNGLGSRIGAALLRD